MAAAMLLISRSAGVFANHSHDMRDYVYIGSPGKLANSWQMANRWSPQMKLLVEGCCSHQIEDAARSCRLSAARKECVSNNCVAKSRT